MSFPDETKLTDVKPPRKWKRLVLFAFAVFLVLMYFTYAPMVNRDFYNVKVLFKPVKCNSYPPTWFGRETQEVFFKNKAGTKLHGIYIPVTDATHTILVHHGQYGNVGYHLDLCGYLKQPEFNVFIYDYAGFGKSEGSPTIAGMADDADAAYDCLVNQLKVVPGEIVQYGASLGSGPAAMLAAEKPCAGLILFSPYTSIKESAKKIFPFMKIYPDFLLTDYDFDNVANVKKLKVPLLVIHGVDDATIDVGHGEQIFSAAREPKTFERIPKQGHTFVITDELKANIITFVENLPTKTTK